MEPLSATASVIAVLQLTSEVINYLNDIKNAPKDCRKCAIEAANLYNLLTNLRFHLDDANEGDPWYTNVRALAVQNGPLDQYKQGLEQLLSQVTSREGVARIKQQLLWKFTKAEVEGILQRMERLKSLVNVALELDHLKLSKAIKNDIDGMRGAMTSVQADVTAIQRVQDLQQDAHQIRQHDAVMHWLSPVDSAKQQHDIIIRKEEGTGEWFLVSAELKAWQHGTGKTLFCPGIPGAGKTMVAAIAIEHLWKRAQSEDIGVAFVFCNYKAQAEQTYDALLASLLRQLAQGRPSQADVIQLYEKHQKQKTKPSLEETTTALQTVCSSYPAAYIVLDALDECIKSTREKLIATLRRIQKNANVRLLCTSRFIPEIEELFHLHARLDVRASEQDIRRYVVSQMPYLPKCIQGDSALAREVQEGIAKTVDGMFLLAQLYVDSLRDTMTKRNVRAALQALERGGAALEHAYGAAVKRIDGQLSGHASLAKQALSWIVHAQRPLTVQELCHALAIEEGAATLDPDAVYNIDDVLSVCAGLVTVDSKSNVVRLVHYTTQEYFEQVRLAWMPRAQRDIAVACLTYLCMDAFVSGPCNSNEVFEERLRSYVLLDYAAHFWAEHTRPEEEAVSDLALVFLSNSALTLVTTQITDHVYEWQQNYSQRFPHYDHGLYLTSRYGLAHLTGTLLEQLGYESRIDRKDTEYGRTPLWCAAANGHEAVVKMLLDTGKVDVDAKSNSGRTPLSLAAQNGREAVVKMLVDTGKVDVNAKDDYDRTPLSLAAESGYEAIVKMLVDTRKADVDAKSNSGRTPLSLAAENGRETIVKMLVDTGKAEVDAKDEYGRTPLSWAAKNGHEAVVKMLVDTGKVDIEAKDKYDRTPLWYAAENGHEAVVKMLLDTGKVDVDAKSNSGRTLLSWAAANRREAVVKMLLDTGKVDIEAKSTDGQTPLSLAARNGHEVVVKMLVDTGKVDVDAKSNSGRTLLSWAAENGYVAVVKMLVDTGKADVNAKDDYAQTPLSLAAQNGREAVVKMLVDTDKADVNAKDEYDRTPLSWAAENGHEAVVKMLVDTGKVDVDAKDDYDRTPLSWAAENGHEAVVKLLLDTGKADVDAKSTYGQTPLWRAAGNGHEAVVKMLLDTGKVDVDAEDTDGRTPLWRAAGNGHEAVVKMLLDTGKVDIEAEGTYGHTPLSRAAKNGHEAVVKLLQSKA